MVTNDDAAKAWAHGFVCGMEYLSGVILDRVDAGQEPAGAILGGQAVGLLFVEQLVMSTQDRARVVDLFRCEGMNYGRQTATD